MLYCEKVACYSREKEYRMHICSIDSLSQEYIGEYGKGTVTKMLGLAAGSKDLYVNIDILPPGTHGSKYHSHTLQEEFFIVLEGEGELRLADRTVKVGPGDFFSKRSGVANAHQFYNSGSTPLRILDIGTVVDGDLCYYPDEDVYMVKALGQAFKRVSALEDWSSDPDA